MKLRVERIISSIVPLLFGTKIFAARTLLYLILDELRKTKTKLDLIEIELHLVPSSIVELSRLSDHQTGLKLKIINFREFRSCSETYQWHLGLYDF